MVPRANALSLTDELKELEAQGITLQPYRDDGHDASGASDADVIAESITDQIECFYPHPNRPPELWPCNATAMRVFIAMQTQWRVGMAGATGLDYAVLPTVLEMLGVTFSDSSLRQKTFFKVQTLEREFLAAWAKKRTQKTSK